MSRSKRDIVDADIREYIDAHRDEVNAGIKAALGQLNGTDAVSQRTATMDTFISSRSHTAAPTPTADAMELPGGS